jgi:AsmA protein
MKKLLLVVGATLALLVVLIILLPFVIDLSRYQTQYLPIVETVLNRKVAIEGMRLTILPRLGARVSGLVVMDDPAFNTGPFVSLASVDIGVKLGPLFRGRIEIADVALREPAITLMKNRQGIWNTSTLGRTERGPTWSAPSGAALQGPFPLLALLAVDRLAIARGTVTYRDQSVDPPVEYGIHDLEVLLNSVRLGQSLSVSAAATVQPFNLPIAVTGTAGPLKETADLQSFDGALRVGSTPFAVQGSVAAGTVTLGITADRIQTAQLPERLRPPTSIEVQDLRAVAELTSPQVRLKSVSLSVFGGKLTAEGGLILDSAPAPFDAKVAADGVQLAPVMAAVGNRQVGVHGRAALELALHGRGFSEGELAQTLEGTAHVLVKDGRIEGIHLVKEGLALLNALGVLPEAVQANVTVFSSLEGRFTVKHGIVTVERLRIDSTDFQATATGRVGFDQSLKLKASLILSEALSKRIGRVQPLKIALVDGRLRVPMVIGGTVQSPTYALDMEQVGAQVQKQVKGKLRELLKSKDGAEALRKAEDAIKELFGR